MVRAPLVVATLACSSTPASQLLLLVRHIGRSMVRTPLVVATLACSSTPASQHYKLTGHPFGARIRGIAEEASALNRIERRISLLMTPSALNRGNFCSNRLVVKVPSLYLRPSSLLMRIGSLSEQNPSYEPVVVTHPSLLARYASLSPSSAATSAAAWLELRWSLPHQQAPPPNVATQQTGPPFGAGRRGYTTN
jgi:hypothetical protein